MVILTLALVLLAPMALCEPWRGPLRFALVCLLMQNLVCAECLSDRVYLAVHAVVALTAVRLTLACVRL